MTGIASKVKATRQTAVKVLAVLAHGLSKGLGIRKPGEMCVEAAVCYALGIEHTDQPPCVSPALRSFKIRLNDREWSSNIARANGLKRLAVAQLGSENMDDVDFTNDLVFKIATEVLPGMLSAPELREASTLEEVDKIARLRGFHSLSIATSRNEKSPNRCSYLAGAIPCSDDNLTEAAEATISVLKKHQAGGTQWLDLVPLH